MGCCCQKKDGLIKANSPGPNKPNASVVDKKIEQAKKTGVLALRECQLKSLPSGATATDTNSYRSVDLTENQLKALPQDIEVWAGLTKLLAGQNKLEQLPATLGGLTSLQKLVLSGNKLKALPDLQQLGKLTILELDDNCLGPELPDVFGGSLAGSLLELNLSQNGLEKLAPSLFSSASLTRLLLVGNKLTALPDGLGALRRLQHLDAADNAIDAVPAGLLQNGALSELWLKGNPADRQQLETTPGWDEFLERRKKRLDAKISSNVVGAVNLSVCGLD